MKLIIAEKPSVAQSIAAALGVVKKQNGFMVGNDWLVSWCFGHLVELANAETYNTQYAKWRYEDLPIIPEPWHYKISTSKHKQFNILKSLMHREDVTEVVNACDAGREGELIFRMVYTLAGCTKPMQRLWISSMEDEAIHDGFNKLCPGSDYDGLYQSALCRAKADWLVGINATRLFSVLYHRTLNVGRVMSPTLALIVEREAQIDAFNPEAFYTVELDCGDFIACSDRLKDKSFANTVADACRGQTASIRNIIRKERSEKAPALYDLTSLQRDANRLLGYTAQQTLDYLQSLYEKRLCTYPRTDARYLTDDMTSSVPTLVAIAASIYGVSNPPKVKADQVCDSKMVSDHHAIVLTASAGKADISALPTGERNILKLVAKRLLCAVSDEYEYAETSVTLDCASHSFTAKGKAVINLGWKVCMRQEQEDKSLPELADGQKLPVNSATVKDGKTTPPKHYTEDTILAAMEVAGTKEKVNCSSEAREGSQGQTLEDAERKGLGTPATRAATIEKLVSTGFVSRQKAKKTVNLIPSKTGVALITILPEQLQSPLLTAEWEQQLKAVEQGKLSPEAFLRGIIEMLQELTKTYTVVEGAETLFPSGREFVGKCPRCGGKVTERKKGYFCENRDCHFGLWMDNKYLASKHIRLSKTDITKLLLDGRIHVKDVYSEKTEKTYSADLLLQDDGERTNFRLEFPNG